jgi:hypothetical protein
MNVFSGRIAALAALLLAGCGPQLPGSGPAADLGAGVIRAADLPPGGPAGAEPGSCWSRDETPARVETVTEQVLIAPEVTAADGTVQRPATWRTETRQRILREREALWFRTPCPELLTPEFLASLQRALAARGLFSGAVTGTMDGATRAAVRAFQRPRGLDSAVLSLEAARALGLVAFDFAGNGG